VVIRISSASDFLCVDLGAAHDIEHHGRAGLGIRRSPQRKDGGSLAGSDGLARGNDPLRQAAHFDVDGTVEAVKAGGIDGDSKPTPAWDVGIRGADAQPEVRRRLANCEAVGVVFALKAAQVAEMNQKLAISGSAEG
jgi:hypothetical protein